MKVPVLVVVQKGVAYVAAPSHVHAAVVDKDAAGEHDPVVLPKYIGFEALVTEQGLTEGSDFRWDESFSPVMYNCTPASMVVPSHWHEWFFSKEPKRSVVSLISINAFRRYAKTVFSRNFNVREEQTQLMEKLKKRIDELPKGTFIWMDK